MPIQRIKKSRFIVLPFAKELICFPVAVSKATLLDVVKAPSRWSRFQVYAALRQISG